MVQRARVQYVRHTRKSENIISLDPSILNRFLQFGPYLDLYISVFRLTALLDCFVVTECFSGFHFQFHSGSLKRIYYSKLYSLTNTLSFECLTLLNGSHICISICCYCSWCCAVWRPYSVAPYTIRSAVYMFVWVLLDQRKYSEKSENIISLGQCTLNRFCFLDLI